MAFLVADGRSRFGGIGLGWGLIDQGFSSATNFGLSVLAGRLLGPDGLGTVFIGFATYLLILEFQHSLLQDPLAISAPSAEDVLPVRSALTIAFTYQVAATIGMAVLGLLLPGDFGRGLLLMAPWMIPLLLQDFCRTVLFRDRRGGLATACDGVWALGMAVTLPLVLIHRTEVAVVACWGIGALFGAVLGMAAIRLRPNGARESWRWWKADITPLARWLGLESAALVLGTQGGIFLTAALVGAGNLGGLRAVQSAFAPMTLVGPAMRMPGLPAIARATRDDSSEEGRKVAISIARRLSFTALVLVVSYFLVLIVAGRPILSLMFGKAFVHFRALILPVGLGQVSGASALGFYILLKATGRGRAVFKARLITAVATFALIGLLASGGSVSGAAWGASYGAAAGWISVAFDAFRRPRSRDAGDEQPELPYSGDTSIDLTISLPIASMKDHLAGAVLTADRATLRREP